MRSIERCWRECVPTRSRGWSVLGERLGLVSDFGNCVCFRGNRRRSRRHHRSRRMSGRSDEMEAS